jgi:hypothetical protein
MNDLRSTMGKQEAGGSSGNALKLQPGSRVGVIGGGPAGAFFSHFLLQLSDRMGLGLQVDVYEPRQFEVTGPRGCNMCGGIISESLVQHLAAEGINLPVSVIRRRIDSYVLHMDVGSVRIETPLHEKRIAAVHRGGGPTGHPDAECGSFDSYLLDLALERGARLHATRIDKTDWDDGRPRVTPAKGAQATYDLLAVAVGVNSPLLGAFERPEIPYRAPKRTKAFVCEFFMGIEMLRRYIGSSMHVYMLDIPGLEFAAIIPKSDYVTVCLLGENIDKTMVDAFLNSNEVRETMPPAPSGRSPIGWCSWGTAARPGCSRTGSAPPTGPPRRPPSHRCSRGSAATTFAPTTGRPAGGSAATTTSARSCSPLRRRCGAIVSRAVACGAWWRASRKRKAPTVI